MLTAYESGRFGYSEERFATEEAAELCAAARRKRAGVKSARVMFNIGESDVDIKNFI
ncbi:MAG: hypothetical protein K2N23_06110 [Clostridia bacterium]|nr:hypothetical protein [Clostridia bacterium]